MSYFIYRRSISERGISDRGISERSVSEPLWESRALPAHSFDAGVVSKNLEQGIIICG
jgi:hypothetical protein